MELIILLARLFDYTGQLTISQLRSFLEQM